jgi:hypothetical protein
MARSWLALPAATVSRTPIQSETTTPSNPHSSFSGDASRSFSVIVVPFTELYEDMMSQAPPSVTIRSNGAR